MTATKPATDFSPLFHPRSIAVIGASQDLTRISGQPIKALKAAGYKGNIYLVNPKYPELHGLKCYPSAASIKALGPQGRGVGSSILVPSPFAPKHAIVRRWQEDMAASGWSDYSLPSLEGYINARVAAEGLRRGGAGVTRESLIGALDRIEALDLGGLRVGFGKGNRIGDNFVDVAVIGQAGRMLS